MSSDSVRSARFCINAAHRELDLRSEPKIMGIVNMTPDSFYDGGAFGMDLAMAVEQALGMVKAGAAIIDIGGESSRPGAERISAEDEIARIMPIIGILREKTDVLISIDTYKAEVAERALQEGAHMVNDISGFTFDAALPGVCRRYGAAVVLMHTPVRPEVMGWSMGAGSEEEDIVERVSGFLRRSIAVAEQHGITDIIIDPGFGFGKSVEENFTLLGRLGELLELGYPILAGVSRKSFLGHAITAPGGEMLPPSERLAATIAAGMIALAEGASILRVHDVAEAVQCLKVASLVRSSTL